MSGLCPNLWFDLIHEFLFQLGIRHRFGETANSMFHVLFVSAGMGLDQDMAFVWPNVLVNDCIDLASEISSLADYLIGVLCRSSLAEKQTTCCAEVNGEFRLEAIYGVLLAGQFEDQRMHSQMNTLHFTGNYAVIAQLRATVDDRMNNDAAWVRFEGVLFRLGLAVSIDTLALLLKQSVLLPLET